MSSSLGESTYTDVCVGYDVYARDDSAACGSMYSNQGMYVRSAVYTWSADVVKR